MLSEERQNLAHRGTCPVCGRRQRMTKHMSVIYSHRAYGPSHRYGPWRKTWKCEGSGQVCKEDQQQENKS
jgi:hypothetical protein